MMTMIIIIMMMTRFAISSVDDATIGPTPETRSFLTPGWAGENRAGGSFRKLKV